MAQSDIDKIISENTPRLRSFVRGKVSNRDDADDIVQDTIYQFLRTMSVIGNPISHVSSWLYTVAHNLIINHGKKKREEPMPAFVDDDAIIDFKELMIADDNDDPDIRMLRSMVWQEFDNALGELPEEQRLAFVMTEIEGLSTRDAAKKTGVGTNTLLSRKHYAAIHIRKRLHALYNELINS